MPSRALLIEVRLLGERYHGAGDWPPSPFRLFQALVAGAYGGRWRGGTGRRKDAAFRWLEGLASAAHRRPAQDRSAGPRRTLFPTTISTPSKAIRGACRKSAAASW